MGHEIPRTQAQIEADKVFQRSLEVREKIKDIPLGYFRACDLKPLVKLFARTGDWLSKDEVVQLENRLEAIKSGKEPINPNL